MSRVYTIGVDDDSFREATQPNSKPAVVPKASGKPSWPHRSRLVLFKVTIVQDGPVRSESGRRLSSISIERISNIKTTCHELRTVVQDILIYVRAQTQNKLAVVPIVSVGIEPVAIVYADRCSRRRNNRASSSLTQLTNAVRKPQRRPISTSSNGTSGLTEIVCIL